MGLATYAMDSSAMEEREALYNLKVQVLQNLTDKFVVDDRILEQNCGAQGINFDIYDTPKYFYSDNNAPYHVTLNHLINQYGTHDVDGTDKLTLYIYSDYIDKAMRFPKFEITNNELLYLNNLQIPC